MIRFAVFVVLIVAVFGDNPHGGRFTIPQMTDQLWVLADIDNDNHLSMVELIREFITNFDHDGSTCVGLHEFVHQWQHNYKDTHSASTHVFQHFDLDGDGEICQVDIENMFHHLDHNGDNLIDKYEFHVLLLYIYGRLPLPDDTAVSTLK